jgi:hypothetical protein
VNLKQHTIVKQNELQNKITKKVTKNITKKEYHKNITILDLSSKFPQLLRLSQETGKCLIAKSPRRDDREASHSDRSMKAFTKEDLHQRRIYGGYCRRALLVEFEQRGEEK